MNIGTLIVTLGADVSGLDRATKSLNTTAQRFRTFGYLASAAITAPMVMASKNAIKMGMDFEFTLKKMIGLAGVAKGSLEQISKEVKDLAANTGIAAQNVAEAYYYVASSGIKGANVLEVTKMAAKGAASGMGEVSDLAKLLTAGMNAYAAEGLKVNEMMDTLTATIRVGKAEPAEMVNALGTILPIAQKLGLDIQDVGGALATMTLITNSTATSATYLRNVLMKLLDPAPQVRDAMESMGISMKQIHALLKTPNGFIKTMELLGATTEKYGVTMDALFPEMRSLLGALNFTGKGLQRLKENTDEVNKSTGAFQAHFEEMSTTMKMRWNKAVVAGKNAVTDLGVSLAMGVVPILEKLVKGLENVTKWFDSLTEAQKRHKLTLLAVIALLGPLSLAISVVMYAISGLTSVVRGFAKVMVSLRLIAVSNPWILIATAIATLVGVLIGARNKTKDFADEQNKLKDILIDVNGEMKKMKDLAEVDYSKMTLTSLSQAYVTAWNAAAEAKKKYDQLVEARGGETKFNAWLKAGKYDILEEGVFKDWEVAKSVVNATAKAMDNFVNSVDKVTEGLDDEVSSIKNVHKLLLEQYDAYLKLENQGIKYSARIKELQSKEPIDYRKFFLKTGFARFGEFADPTTILENWNARGLISEREFLDAKLEMDLKSAGENADARMRIETQYYKDLRLLRSNDIQSYLQSASSAIGAISDLIEANKQRELSIVGDNARRREEIERRYFLKQKAWAIAQAVINGALAITNMIANVPLSVLNPATWVGIGIAAASTAAQVAIIAGQRMKEGGIVPSGYPNDTYPAMLSSGEKIIPPHPLGGLERKSDIADMLKDVVFHIEGTELVGVFKNHNRKTNSYS